MMIVISDVIVIKKKLIRMYGNKIVVSLTYIHNLLIYLW